MRDFLKLDSLEQLCVNKSNIVGYRTQKGFKVQLNEIKVVGLKGQISLDEENLYICMIDKNGISYNVNSYFLNESSMQILIDHFNFSAKYFF